MSGISRSMCRSVWRFPGRGVAGGIVQWTPAALFAAGQQGVWYEPRPEYLYQDSAGTTPVTADGQPVGLMLDLSQGLVKSTTEEVVNGDFSNGGTSWANEGAWTFTNNRIEKDGATLDAGRFYQTGVVEANKYYELTFDVTINQGSIADNTQIGSAKINSAITTSGTKTFRLFTSTSLSLSVFPSDDFDGWVDNISVRELKGNHATQSTAAAKPLYRTGGTLQQYDEVDDLMNVALPAIASATVITAKATGVVVQYPVDLSSGTYTITESHSGIIIRDGQLSASEEQAAVDYLSGMQGVA